MQRFQTSIFLLLFTPSLFAEVIDTLPAGIYHERKFTREEIEQVIALSDAFRGLQKIKTIDSSGITIDTARWPIGSWGRGYQTWPTWSHATFMNNRFYEYYYAHHPLMRDVACFVRGHLHLYLAGYEKENIVIIKDGIDYMLSQQRKSGEGIGGFDWWITRDERTSIYMSENKDHPFETCYALVAMSEYYLSEIDYRRDEMYQGIISASGYIARIDWKNFDNANHRALGLWALSTAYKVTKDSCAMIEIKKLAKWLINKQHQGRDSENGLWKMGGKDAAPQCTYWHDTRIIYHFFMIRGLVEAFSITPDHDLQFKYDLAACLKRAINHVIRYRLVSPSPKIPDLYNVHKDRCGNLVPGGTFSIAAECYVDVMSEITYISQQSNYFTPEESTNLQNLAHKFASGLSANEKWHICAIGIYVNYMQALHEGRSIFE